MADFGPFVDGESNRRCEREQEGFARALNVGEDEIPCCGSVDGAFPVYLTDARGPIPSVGGAGGGQSAAYLGRRAVEWETSAAESTETTVFTWIGGNQV